VEAIIHIYKIVQGERFPLCGKDEPVSETALYGLECGNCQEEARFLLRGGK